MNPRALRYLGRSELALVVTLLGSVAMLAFAVIMMTDRTTPVENAGSQVVPQPAPEPSAASFTPHYPGQPEPGTVLWGASIHGNGDPVERHEAHADARLGVRRTFFQWDHRTGWLLQTARDDIDAGRLPWVSVKTPGWNAVAEGLHDEEIDELLEELDQLDGPVWLTVHHEPEGGGGDTSDEATDDPAGPAGHLAMNRRVRERMDELEVDNVALLPVLMAWSFDPRSGREPAEYWDEGIYDLLGVDIYSRDGRGLTSVPSWDRVRKFAAAREVDIAVGEWGIRGDPDQARPVRRWYEAAIASGEDPVGSRVVALSAFDSALNSPEGSWELEGARLETFWELLSDPRSAAPAPAPAD